MNNTVSMTLSGESISETYYGVIHLDKNYPNGLSGSDITYKAVYDGLGNRASISIGEISSLSGSSPIYNTIKIGKYIYPDIINPTPIEGSNMVLSGDNLIFEYKEGDLDIGESLSDIGLIMMYSSTNIPDGWLLCNGNAIPAEYTELINLIGANTPDLRGRFILLGNTSSLNITGGNEDIQGMPNHYHNLSYETRPNWHADKGGSEPMGTFLYTNGTEINIESTDILTGSVDNTTDYKNMPPFFVLNYIIKAL